MKRFFRENPTIAFGLGLPLLLVTLFLLASGLPSLLVAPPQYDLLFATGYNHYRNHLQLSVIDRSVQLIDLGNHTHNHNIQLWRYHVNTGAVQEIAYILPPALTTEKIASTFPQATPIEVPDLQGVIVDSSSIAPDGYTFNIDKNASSNLFAGLFYVSRYRYGATLSKSGRHISLPNITSRYSRSDLHFIGWVVSP